MINPKPGDLIEFIEARDQSYYTKTFIGKLGIVIESVPAKSSTNIWKILVDDKFEIFHSLDFKLVQRSFRDD